MHNCTSIESTPKHSSISCIQSQITRNTKNSETNKKPCNFLCFKNSLETNLCKFQTQDFTEQLYFHINC